MKYLVVKTGGGESSVARRLRAEGEEVDELTVGRIEPLTPDVPDCEWVVLTSRNAAFAAASRRVAAIGPETARAAEEAGAEVAFLPSRADSATFIAEFSKVVKPSDRVVRLKPKGSEDSLAALAEFCRYDALDAYENVALDLPGTVDLTSYDAAYFTSPSAVERLSPVVCGTTDCRAIGPATAQALRKCEWAAASRGRAMFPVFIDLSGRRCLVVGAGPVARRKAETLGSFGASVDIVSPELNRPFSPSDADGCALVIAATNDGSVNAAVARACRERGIPVNVVDDAQNCTFFVPAIARKGSVVAAVSSGGRCPAAAQLLRDAVEPFMTEGFVAETERLGLMRDELKRQIPDHRERAEHCRKKLEESLMKENRS